MGNSNNRQDAGSLRVSMYARGRGPSQTPRATCQGVGDASRGSRPQTDSNERECALEQLRWLFVEGFVLAFLLVYFLMPKACRLGLVDWPKGRKRHARAVPLIGGLAIFIAYLVALPSASAAGGADLLLLAGAGLLVLVGALDDYFDFPTWPRFAAQIAAGACMIAGGVVLLDLGAITPQGAILHLGFWAVPFTIFATVGMINALNMSDGIDGLSGCLSLVAIAALGVVAIAAGQDASAAKLVVLGGAIVGFLTYNLRTPLRRSAAVFLGDAGSMFLGFTLTWFLIALSQGEARAMPPASALWLVALPLMDTLYSILRRLAAQRSPLAPDDQHLHHLLLDAGLTVQQTVAVLTAVATLLASVGVAGAVFDWPEFTLAAGFAATFGCYCLAATGTRLHLQRRSRRGAGTSASRAVAATGGYSPDHRHPDASGASTLVAESQRSSR